MNNNKKPQMHIAATREGILNIFFPIKIYFYSW